MNLKRGPYHHGINHDRLTESKVLRLCKYGGPEIRHYHHELIMHANMDTTPEDLRNAAECDYWSE